VADLARLNQTASPLIERAQRGDGAAFADLVTLWYAQIHRWALARTGDPDDANDVTQDVVMRLERAIRTYEARSRFSTWLYRVVMSTALDQGRRGRRARQAATRHSAREPVSTDPGVEGIEAMARGELVRLIRQWYRELPAQQREAFDLVDLQGHAPSDASELMGVAPATVRAHLFRARRAIRERALALHPELVEDLS
jgi:RNA polymerase sigma-70 factor (ECF subfamily)